MRAGALSGAPSVLVRSTDPRAPLLNTDQLLQQAEQLAQSHRINDRQREDRQLAHLTDNARVLTQTCRLLSAAEQAGRRLTPAGTWLLDNIYLIDEHVAIARRHLPAGYSRQLPQLASGSSAGLPRVYDIVLNAIAHGDGRVDADVLGRYVAAYQNVTPLTLGELWAIPIMLRLALIDNLQRIARRVSEDRLDRNRADAWADTLTEVAANDPKSLVLAVADLARSAPPATSSFVAELARRLQGHGSALAMPLTWIEQWLSDIGATIEDMVHAESQQQAAAQVSVSNSIASLRLLAKVDWRNFVESVSVVERHLRGDPSGVYSEMDFATRDRYRHVIEQLARRSGSTEEAVAMEAVALAAQAAAHQRCDCVEAHVGYYLIDDGRAALDRALRIGGVARWVRTDRRSRLLLYTVAYAVIVAAGTWALLARSWGAWPPGWRWLVAGLAAIAFSELAVALVNRAATHAHQPATAPATRPVPGHRGPPPHDGGRADDADDHRHRPRTGGSLGGLLPRESRRRHPLRVADRLRRRRHRNVTRRPRPVERCDTRSQQPQHPLRLRSHRPVLPTPPASPVEPGRGHAGWRWNANEANSER